MVVVSTGLLLAVTSSTSSPVLAGEIEEKMCYGALVATSHQGLLNLPSLRGR